jgi:uncharacterized protein (UPF0276 family)
MEAVAGIGLRAPHLAEIARDRPAVGFLEVHAENHLGHSPAVQAVERLRADYPLSLHAVGLSLGSTDGIDPVHLARVAAAVKRLQPDLVSEHLAWSSFGGRYFNDLLPLPYNAESLAVVSANIQRVQDALGRAISIENPSCYLGFRHSTMSEPAFLAELVRRTGCGLLLDINNVVVTAHNLGLDPREWLDLPAHAVTQFHLAGYAVNEADGETILIDDHGSRVRPEVWALFSEAVARIGPRPTLIEWDTDLPPLAVLLDEARVALQRLTGGGALGSRAA